MISRRQELCLNRLERRILDEAEYIRLTKSTIRQTAKKFMVSKSTVYKDMMERLVLINPRLYGEIKDVIMENKSERHLRGGYATHIKYLKHI